MKKIIFALVVAAAAIVTVTFNASKKQDPVSSEIVKSHATVMQPMAMTDSNF